MEHKVKIHELLDEAAAVLLDFVKSREALHEGGWVPTAEIKEALELNLVAVPSVSKQYGKKGWVFASLARLLEDKGKLEYKLVGSRAYCKSSAP